MSSIDHNLKRDSYDKKFLSPEPQQEHVDSAAAESVAPAEQPAGDEPQELEGEAAEEQSAPEPKPEPEDAA